MFKKFDLVLINRNLKKDALFLIIYSCLLAIVNFLVSILFFDLNRVSDFYKDPNIINLHDYYVFYEMGWRTSASSSLIICLTSSVIVFFAFMLFHCYVIKKREIKDIYLLELRNVKHVRVKTIAIKMTLFVLSNLIAIGIFFIAAFIFNSYLDTELFYVLIFTPQNIWFLIIFLISYLICLIVVFNKISFESKLIKVLRELY